jgi:hypothetical protein
VTDWSSIIRNEIPRAMQPPNRSDATCRIVQHPQVSTQVSPPSTRYRQRSSEAATTLAERANIYVQ